MGGALPCNLVVSSSSLDAGARVKSVELLEKLEARLPSARS